MLFYSDVPCPPPRMEVEVNPSDVELYRSSFQTYGKHSAEDELWMRIRKWRSKDSIEQKCIYEATLKAAQMG